MKDIPDKSIDLVVTDCPYKIVSGGCTNKGNNHGILNKEYASDGKLFKYNDIHFSEWLPEVYRVLKDDTHCYIMINSRNLKELQTEAEKVGFKFQNLIVWNKGNATPNRYYMNACEMILLLRKGKAKNINNMGTKNIIDTPNIIGNKLHPTEKPVELMEIFIKNSSNEYDIVLDPFLGSGVTTVACVNTGRHYVGFELDPEYYDIACKRLDEAESEVILIDKTIQTPGKSTR